MISFAECPPPDPVVGDFSQDGTLDALIQDMANVITEAHTKHVNAVFAAAVLKENGGVMPTPEELQQWCRTLVMVDGTMLLAWKAPDWGPGDKIDMSYVIAKVPPPKI